MYTINTTHRLPGWEPEHATGCLRLHQDRNGRVTIGWDIVGLEDDEVFALGCTPALTADEALRVAQDLVRQLFRVLPMVVDAPPFP